MIQFACKTVDLGDIIKCGLGLTKAEVSLFEFFVKNKTHFTTQDLSKKLSLDLSTVQRGVKKLYDQKVLDRKQTNVAGGGYFFSYAAVDTDLIKRSLMKTIKGWVSNVEGSLDDWMK